MLLSSTYCFFLLFLLLLLVPFFPFQATQQRVEIPHDVTHIASEIGVVLTGQSAFQMVSLLLLAVLFSRELLPISPLALALPFALPPLSYRLPLVAVGVPAPVFVVLLPPVALVAVANAARLLVIPISE